VLLADHARQTLGVCDRAALLVGGKIVREGPSEALWKDPVVREAWLGEDERDANVKPMV
jgi:lipopolysaccharide export system ATP-binding protein